MCSIKKYKILFIKKNFPKKLISRHNEQPNPLTRQEYKGKIYVKNIRKIYVGSETNWKVEPESFRIHNTAARCVTLVEVESANDLFTGFTVPAACARIYRPSFRENKTKTLVFNDWKMTEND